VPVSRPSRFVLFVGLNTTKSGAHNVDSRPVPFGYVFPQPRHKGVLCSGSEVGFNLGDHPKTLVPQRQSWQLAAREHSRCRVNECKYPRGR